MSDTPTSAVHNAYREALAADDAFSDALRAAKENRYSYHYKNPTVVRAHARWVAADLAYRQAVNALRSTLHTGA